MKKRKRKAPRCRYSIKPVASPSPWKPLVPGHVEIVNGELPPGLTLDPRTGIIAGRYKRVGKYEVAIRLANGPMQTIAFDVRDKRRKRGDK